MSQLVEVKVPDIGDYKDVPVIEVMVKAGDAVKADDPLVTLESDKATMDVPAPAAGTVKEVRLKLGDKVSEGTLVLLLDAAAAASPLPAGEGPEVRAAAPASEPAPARAPTVASPRSGGPGAPAAAPGAAQEVKVPDIGDYKDVPIIEVMVKPGDTVKADDPLVTLESDKATMDVPAPAAGVVQELRVKLGDKVSEGSVILTLAAEGASASPLHAGEGTGVRVEAPASAPAASPHPQSLSQGQREASSAPGGAGIRPAHASPSVRRFARELGVDVGKVPGSGPKGRILHEDVQNFVKGVMAQAGPGAAPASPAGGVSGGGTLDLLPWPKVDFTKFGPVEAKPLARIKKISGANLARNWVMIPHVTQFEEADITELEAFRVQMNKEAEKAGGAKLTMLAFLIKASVATLKKFPEFNASLDGDNLILKQYYHIGFAADTPNGLVVPVIRDADKKGVAEIATEMGALAKKAREGKLGPAEMQGGCFSISSLGGIGGTAFTPIINAPEVAILGVSKNQMKPVWDGKAFQPRMLLPLSLSYDHRVIDGASAARFAAHLAQLLGDMRRAML